jgi:hypothetical protein
LRGRASWRRSRSEQNRGEGQRSIGARASGKSFSKCGDCRSFRTAVSAPAPMRRITSNPGDKHSVDSARRAHLAARRATCRASPLPEGVKILGACYALSEPMCRDGLLWVPRSGTPGRGTRAMFRNPKCVPGSSTSPTLHCLRVPPVFASQDARTFAAAAMNTGGTPAVWNPSAARLSRADRCPLVVLAITRERTGGL